MQDLDLGYISKVANEKEDMLESFMRTLPDKALGLGIRVALTLVFLFIGRFAINFVRKLSRNALERAKVDKGVVQFVDSFLSIVLWAVLGISIAVNYGIDAASVVALLGSAGLAIGLSLQGALSNFAGGLLILMLHPFYIGEYIIENSTGTEGVVTEINVFYTHLVTRDNRVVVVPNGKLADTSLINASRLKKRMLDLRFGISYDSDLKRAKEVCEEMIRSTQTILEGEPVSVFVFSLDDSAVTLGVRVWVNASDYWATKWQLNEKIKLAFDDNDIKIPFKQMDVHIDDLKN